MEAWRYVAISFLDDVCIFQGAVTDILSPLASEKTQIRSLWPIQEGPLLQWSLIDPPLNTSRAIIALGISILHLQIQQWLSPEVLCHKYFTPKIASFLGETAIGSDVDWEKQKWMKSLEPSRSATTT